MVTKRVVRARSKVGQLTEFGPALLLLVMCFIVPMSNLAVLTMRCSMAASLVQKQAAELAVSDKFSGACSRFYEDPNVKVVVTGTSVKSHEVLLEAVSLSSGQSRAISVAKTLTPEWLPSGAKAPCNYDLVVKQTIEVSPLFSLRIPGISVPGLTGPVPLNYEARAHWQNLTRDPLTSQFYLNE